MYYKINDKLAMGAEVYKTRYSWGHKAHLYRVPELSETGEKWEADEYVTSVKVTYYNRTWERFEFESALKQLVAKALKNREITKDEAETCNTYIKNYNEQETKAFKSIARVAQLGELFGDTQKEKNDWKTRMLKAGLEGKGLIMPDNWDELSEDEKTRRLDLVIAELK